MSFMNYDGTTELSRVFAHRNQPYSNSGNSLPAGPGESGDNKFYCWWYNNAEFKASTKIPDADSINVTILKYICVKYDANGGSVSPNRSFVVPGEMIGNMPTPNRYGYGFSGWFSDRDNGSQYFSHTVPKINVNLFAHWNCTHPSSYREVVNNDCTRYEYVDRCTVCGATLGSHVGYGEHDFSGRCGVTHTLRVPTHLSFHAGTYKTKYCQHIVCTKCNAYRNNARDVYCFGHASDSFNYANGYKTNCAKSWRSRKEMKCRYPQTLEGNYWRNHPKGNPELY